MNDTRYPNVNPWPIYGQTRTNFAKMAAAETALEAVVLEGFIGTADTWYSTPTVPSVPATTVESLADYRGRNNYFTPVLSWRRIGFEQKPVTNIESVADDMFFIQAAAGGGGNRDDERNRWIIIFW